MVWSFAGGLSEEFQKSIKSTFNGAVDTISALSATSESIRSQNAETENADLDTLGIKPGQTSFSERFRNLLHLDADKAMQFFKTAHAAKTVPLTVLQNSGLEARAFFFQNNRLDLLSNINALLPQQPSPDMAPKP